MNRFNFFFLLGLGMIMYDNKTKTNKNLTEEKIKPRDTCE